jgi:transketolase
MRKTFAQLLTNFMSKEKSAVFLTADLGYKFFDEILNKHPDRAFNTGAAEQLMLGACVGISLQGNHIPICYSITPFLLYRPFEIIRNYINYENLPVKLIGSGRDKDYAHDGFSHWAEDDRDVMKLFPNIHVEHPKSIEHLSENFESLMYSKKPVYINLKR